MNPITKQILTSQVEFEDQLKLLNSIDNLKVREFAQQTLNSWNGREVSIGQLNSAAEKLRELVISALNSKSSTQEQDKLQSTLKMLKKVKRKAKDIDVASVPRLNKRPKIEPKKVEEILKKLDEKKLDQHPAYRNWTKDLALRVLRLPTTHTGTFIIIRDKENLTLLIKRESNTEEYYLVKREDTAGYTVFHPPALKLEEDMYSEDEEKDVDLDQPSSTAPEVLNVPATPLDNLNPKILSLLKFYEQLASIKFDNKGSPDWSKLKSFSAKTKAPGNRPQYASSENIKRASVYEINLASKTAKQLERNGKAVFFHCNTVKLGKNEFDCHQLPNDYSRDDIWLSLWEDAGKGNKTATIMKLSTARCPGSNDLPVIRDYWPVNKKDPSIDKFQSRCTHAEKSLQGFEKSKKVVGLKDQISKLEHHKKFLEKDLLSLKDFPEDDTSLERSKTEQLNKEIQEHEKMIESLRQQLNSFETAAKEHLSYVKGEMEAAASQKGSGVFIGSLTTVDGITVEHIKETSPEDFPGVVLRKFKLTKSGVIDPRFVTQIDYSYWADFNSASAGVLPKLREVYQKVHGENPAPMKVHCRAGVGRTGTFISFCGAMDIIEEAVKNGKIDELDARTVLFDIISSARSQRDVQMVQTPKQGQQIVYALESEVFKMASQIDN